MTTLSAKRRMTLRRRTTTKRYFDKLTSDNFLTTFRLLSIGKNHLVTPL